jgi:hypothetical protein
MVRKGGEAPLLLKSNSISTVHRRVPLDIVVVPILTGAEVTGLSIHAGLWTSAALFAIRRKCRCCARGSPGWRRSSASIPRAIPARR